MACDRAGRGSLGRLTHGVQIPTETDEKTIARRVMVGVKCSKR